MTKKTIVASLLACVALLGHAQEVKTEKPEAKAKGKVILQAFGNFHAGFGALDGERQFEMDRAYLGYEYNFGNGLSIKGVVDMGAKGDGYDRIVYLKNMQVSWKKGRWTLNGGLISTTQFNAVEKFWGYRYIYKSFQDQYKFGSSADLGLSASFKAADWVTIDAIITNGEGYKKVQYKDGFQYGLGATFTPAKGLTMRAYVGLNEQPDGKNVMNYAAFAGYKNDRFSLGAEYNYMQNYKGVADHDKSGFSVYGTVVANKWLNVYARYDNLMSKDDWAQSDDEGMLLVGAQFKVGKNVKLAPNFRMTMPKADGAENGYAVYASCYFGL